MKKFSKKFKLISSIVAASSFAVVSPLIVTACNPQTIEQGSQVITPENLRIASFNISFAVDGEAETGGPDYYARWKKYFSYTREQQDKILADWVAVGSPKVEKGQNPDIDTDNTRIAHRIAQIRNIAASIQYKNPDIILLNEFNTNGYNDKELMILFSNNYLSHSQTYDGVLGTKTTKPIHFPYMEAYATNTGLLAVDENGNGMDLDNDGYVGKQAANDIHGGVDAKGNPIVIRKGQVYIEKGTYNGENKHKNKPIYEYEPDDTFGFGYYHGHYAFGVMSKYPLDFQNQRTFQTFKLKDMPAAQIYKAKVDKRIMDNNGTTITKKFYDGVENSGKEGDARKHLNVGDNWYNDTEWNNFRMSSKNHVDLPVKIGSKTIHLLLSHPTPAAFDKASPANILRNRAEIDFWRYYVDPTMNNELYDDNGIKGGIDGSKDDFVILGDLNADALVGDDDNKLGSTTDNNANHPTAYNQKIGIEALASSNFVNTEYTIGSKIPVSNGAAKYKNPISPNHWAGTHPKAEIRTAVFGNKPDWAIPSRNLNVIDGAVFWDHEDEEAYKLFVDERLGKYGDSKEVTSDHRMIYLDIKLK